MINQIQPIINKEVIPLDEKKKVDISQYEDVEEEDNYSAPCVIAYDAEDAEEDSQNK